jgi:hypothetical protein
VAAIAVLYGAVASFPQPLFAYRVKQGAFTVYSTQEIPDSLAAVLGRAETLLSASELYDPDGQYQVFLCNGYRLYAFLCPSARHAAASARWLPENIVVGNPDIDYDRAFSDQDQAFPEASPYRPRRLSGTIAHEVTHLLIRKRFGRMKALRLPAWISEGICDFVADDSHFDRAKGVKMLRQGISDPSGWFWYFKCRMMIGYLVRKKGLSIPEIVDGEFDAAQVEQEMVAALRSGAFQ